MEFVKISENARIWHGINRESLEQERPVYTVSYMEVGSELGLSCNGGYYHKVSEEPCWTINNGYCSKSELTVSLSELNNAMKYYGMKLNIEQLPESVPFPTSKEMYDKSKSLGLERFQPGKGSSKICLSCKHNKRRHECAIKDDVKLERFNDGIEYCSKVLNGSSAVTI